MKKSIDSIIDPEIAAISNIYAALRELDPDAQSRVIGYVVSKLRIADPPTIADVHRPEKESLEPLSGGSAAAQETTDENSSGEDEGISPVAKKWLARNNLLPKQLGALFSVAGDEIDLIAKSVPGKNKKEKMHQVFLLKGVAAYLAEGAARFSHEQVKEACLHYDAYDASNFASNFKSLASEVSGSKEHGYALTPRGLASAMELVKNMIS